MLVLLSAGVVKRRCAKRRWRLFSNDRSGGKALARLYEWRGLNCYNYMVKIKMRLAFCIVILYNYLEEGTIKIGVFCCQAPRRGLGIEIFIFIHLSIYSLSSSA